MLIQREDTNIVRIKKRGYPNLVFGWDSDKNHFLCSDNGDVTLVLDAMSEDEQEHDIYHDFEKLMKNIVGRYYLYIDGYDDFYNRETKTITMQSDPFEEGKGATLTMKMLPHHQIEIKLCGGTLYQGKTRFSISDKSYDFCWNPFQTFFADLCDEANRSFERSCHEFYDTNRLIETAKTMINIRNAPRELYNEFYSIFHNNYNDISYRVEDDHYEGSVIVNEYQFHRLFTYKIDVFPGKKILMFLNEKRTNTETNEISTYIDTYDITCDKIKCIVKSSLGTDATNPEDVRSRYIYVNPTHSLSEPLMRDFSNYQYDEPYTIEEAKFILKVSKMFEKTEYLKEALKKARSYVHMANGDYYLSFSFDQKDNMMNYGFTLVDDQYNFYIFGNMEEVKVKILSKSNNYEEVSYEDFVSDDKNNQMKEKIQEVVSKLEHLGVNIKYGKTREI